MEFGQSFDDPFTSLNPDLEDLGDIIGRCATTAENCQSGSQSPDYFEASVKDNGWNQQHSDWIDNLFSNLPESERRQLDPDANNSNFIAGGEGMESSVAAIYHLELDRGNAEGGNAPYMNDQYHNLSAMESDVTTHTASYEQPTINVSTGGQHGVNLTLSIPTFPPQQQTFEQREMSYPAAAPTTTTLSPHHRNVQNPPNRTVVASTVLPWLEQQTSSTTVANFAAHPQTRFTQASNMKMTRPVGKADQTEVRKLLRQLPSNDQNAAGNNTVVGVATKFGPAVARNLSKQQVSQIVTRREDQEERRVLRSGQRRSNAFESISDRVAGQVSQELRSGTPRTSKSEESASSIYDGDRSEQTPKEKPKVKGQRRTAHNLIEKRYRCSINDRINELKVILLGDEAKLNKSAVLRKAVDHVIYLRRQNDSLREENAALKHALESKGIPCPPNVTVGRNGANSTNPIDWQADSPRSSSSLCDSRSSSVAQSLSSAERPGDVSPGWNATPPNVDRHNAVMMDRSRVALFGFLAFVVLLNPLKLMLYSSPINDASFEQATVIGPGRTLKAVGGYEALDEANVTSWSQELFKTAVVWFLNAIVIACILARLLIHGEPVIDQTSESMTNFHRHKVQADHELERGNAEACVEQLLECLQSLSRPVPATTLDRWAALLWQICRQWLNRIWIGKWLSKRGRAGMKPDSIVQSHARAAGVYHRLHKLHFMGYGQGGHLCGLTLALSAVNLAESAGDAVESKELAEIYAMAALRIRSTFPRLGSLAVDCFRLRASDVCQRNGIAPPPTVGWLLTSHGHSYIRSSDPLGEFRAGILSPFCVVKSQHCPLEHFAAGFKIELLKKLCNALIWAKDGTYDQWLPTKTVNGYPYRELVEWTRMLGEISKPSATVDGHAPVRLTPPDCGDDQCTWWANLLGCAVNWEAADLPQARLKYQVIRNAPKVLLAERLALAAGHASCARKVCVEHSKKNDYEQIVWMHCSKAAAALSQCSYKGVGDDSIENLVVVISYDWLLQSLVEIWYNRVLSSRRHYWEQKAPSQLANAVQSHVAAFRRTAGDDSALEVKVLIYEIFSRMMFGANPVATEHMYSHCCHLARLAPTSTSQSDKRNLDILKRLLSH